jgi:hypothetical protein
MLSFPVKETAGRRGRAALFARFVWFALVV